MFWQRWFKRPSQVGTVRENAVVSFDCVFVFPNAATTIAAVMSTKYEIRAESVPGRPKERESTKKEDPKALFEYCCNRNTLLFHQFQIVYFSVSSNHTDNIGGFGQTTDIEAVVVAEIGDLSALQS